MNKRPRRRRRCRKTQIYRDLIGGLRLVPVRMRIEEFRSAGPCLSVRQVGEKETYLVI